MLGGEGVSDAVSSRVEKAMSDLSIKAQRQQLARAAAAAGENQHGHTHSHAGLKTCCRVKASPSRDQQEIRAEDSEEEEDEDEFDKLLDDDPEIRRLRELRMKQLKQQQQKRDENLAKGYRQYREITQDEFLPEVTNTELVLLHFYHNDFERCKIMDKHLKLIAGKYDCKFLKIDAAKAPFFIDKLKVRTLPTLIGFKDGVALPVRQIGFEGLISNCLPGREDEWKTIELEKRLSQMGLIELDEEDCCDDDEHHGRKPFLKISYGGSKAGDSDEDD